MLYFVFKHGIFIEHIHFMLIAIKILKYLGFLSIMIFKESKKFLESSEVIMMSMSNKNLFNVNFIKIFQELGKILCETLIPLW